MPSFATLTERNAWEGETWHHYLPIEGNEAALATLHAALSRGGSFTLQLDPLTEADVDRRIEDVDPDDVGYMQPHTKLVGRLRGDILRGLDRNGLLEALYKGGIRELVEVSDAG